MKREARYIVLKFKDFDRILTALERKILMEICDKVAGYRAEVGKPPLKCVVVEADWPEYEPVWQMIERRMDGHCTPSRDLGTQLFMDRADAERDARERQKLHDSQPPAPAKCCWQCGGPLTANGNCERTVQRLKDCGKPSAPDGENRI